VYADITANFWRKGTGKNEAVFCGKPTSRNWFANSDEIINHSLERAPASREGAHTVIKKCDPSSGEKPERRPATKITANHNLGKAPLPVNRSG
jgi:hypothetical protein